MSMCVCMHACLCVHAFMCLYDHVPMRVCLCVHICAHSRVCSTCVHVCIRMCMWVFVCAQVCMCIGDGDHSITKAPPCPKDPAWPPLPNPHPHQVPQEFVFRQLHPGGVRRWVPGHRGPQALASVPIHGFPAHRQSPPYSTPQPRTTLAKDRGSPGPRWPSRGKEDRTHGVKLHIPKFHRTEHSGPKTPGSQATPDQAPAGEQFQRMLPEG